MSKLTRIFVVVSSAVIVVSAGLASARTSKTVSAKVRGAVCTELTTRNPGLGPNGLRLGIANGIAAELDPPADQAERPAAGDEWSPSQSVALYRWVSRQVSVAGIEPVLREVKDKNGHVALRHYNPAFYRLAESLIPRPTTRIAPCNMTAQKIYDTNRELVRTLAVVIAELEPSPTLAKFDEREYIEDREASGAQPYSDECARIARELSEGTRPWLLAPPEATVADRLCHLAFRRRADGLLDDVAATLAGRVLPAYDRRFLRANPEVAKKLVSPRLAALP